MQSIAYIFNFINVENTVDSNQFNGFWVKKKVA
jgi:hypothetical protein